MTITRAQIEKTLLKRASKKMAFVEMDAATNDGTNADLNDPIVTALMQMGITPADITDVADSDLVTVTDALRILDLAELRLLENIVGNLDVVDFSVGQRRESLGQMAKDCETAITRLSNKIQRQYGIGVAKISAGVLTLDFMQQEDND